MDNLFQFKDGIVINLAEIVRIVPVTEIMWRIYFKDGTWQEIDLNHKKELNNVLGG